MCLEEEMPENSITITGPEKEEQTLGIPVFPQGHGAVQKRDPVWDMPSGKAAERLLVRGIGENEATSPPSRGKRIPAVVYNMLEILFPEDRSWIKNYQDQATF